MRSIIDVAGLSYREIERTLASEGHGFNVARMLSGRFELRLHQVLDVLRVLEIHPAEFFRLVFKDPPMHSPLLERIRELFGAVRAPAVAPRSTMSGPQPTIEGLQRRVDELGRLVDELRGRPAQGARR
ncbi:MAG TPA: hypothetical protein VHB47_09490 [Thermoanaerobaculia bacterium]|nr:hypothetical protein [Thermoanaerobaculia bacterium]